MGDKRRNEIFCKWITHHYPPNKYLHVLCVADGNYELTSFLIKSGYIVESWEPKPRKNGYYNLVKNKCRIIRKPFKHDINSHANLIIGMHPDEATVEIILYAKKHKIPFAVVPCCVKGDIKYICNVGCKYINWINRLKQIYGDCTHEMLNISGRNVVIWDKPKTGM